MKTILKLLWGLQSNYWGGYIPPCFGTTAIAPPLACQQMQNKKYHVFSTTETVFRTEI